MAECKSCKANIEWICTPDGKKQPIDAKPKKMWVYFETVGWQLVDCYESHFSTCPDADKHRKPKSDKCSLGKGPECKECDCNVPKQEELL